MIDDLRSPFFETGMRILGDEGYAGLKQAAVCSALGVTTGAFYHSFVSWKDYTDQLLGHWRRERTTNLVALVEAEDDPVARLVLMLEMSLQLPHRAEAAIRVWSLLAPEVAAVQDDVDTQRFTVVEEALSRLVGHEEAPQLAHAAVAMVIGFEQQRDPDPQTMRWGLELLLEAARARSLH